MDEEIAELEKTGATELAAKLREKWTATKTSLDTLKAEHSAAASKASKLEKEAAKYKADLEAAGKGTDERLTALQKETAEHKALAEKHAAEFESFKLRTKLGDKLGIPDAKRRDRALDAFLKDYRPEGAGFDDKGELQGFDAALEAFKKAESFYFGQADGGFGGDRGGSDPKPGPKPGSGKADKVTAWETELYGPPKGAKA